MKVIKAAVLFLSILGFFNIGICPANGQKPQIGINTVVIDAGHGGKDAGAVYGKYLEKDIVLNIALRLGALIKENYPDVKVVYTRSTDKFIEVHERGNIANRASADLFISIHTNSFTNSSANGTETYVMGLANSERNMETVMKENNVIEYEEDYKTKYAGFQPGNPESLIVFSLMQYANQDQSLNFADLIQKNYNKSFKMFDRGVKQGPFLVLWKPAMPSILTEVGFLSNAEDRKNLISKNGQEQLARCLFNAFSEYKTRIDGKGRQIVLDNVGGSSQSTNTGTTSSPSANRMETAQNSTQKEEILYRVQVLSSARKVPKNSSSFGPYRGEVIEIIIDNRYKYFVGGTTSRQEALSLQRKVRKDISDAFVVVFRNGKPVQP